MEKANIQNHSVGLRSVKTGTKTGASDSQYALVSTLYHCLKGADTASTYEQDAMHVNDDELVEFFKETQNMNRSIAERAQSLLAQRLGENSRTNKRVSGAV